MTNLSKDEGAYQATPKEKLEEEVMSANTPKSEQMWWAVHEIEKLREQCKKYVDENEELQAELSKVKQERDELKKIKEYEYQVVLPRSMYDELVSDLSKYEALKGRVSVENIAIAVDRAYYKWKRDNQGFVEPITLITQAIANILAEE